MLGTGNYVNMRIVDANVQVMGNAEIEDGCGKTYYHPESLLVQAHQILTADPGFKAMGLQTLLFLPSEDHFVVRTIATDDQTLTGPRITAESLEGFRDDPRGLAEWLVQLLPGKRPAYLPTITDKRYLFLRACDELQGRCESDDEYTMLGIAGILRLLLWDEMPLIDQVNRQHRLKLLFVVGATIPVAPKEQPKKGAPHGGTLRRVQSGLLMQAVEDSFFPKQGQGTPMKRDAFLALPVLMVGGHVYSVRDVLRHMAYVGGTIHAYDPSDEKDQALHEIRGLLQTGGVGPGLRTLRAIGRVVLVCMGPLRKATHEDIGQQQT